MNRFTVNGIHVAVADRGQGLPLVLVHGFPLDHSMWDAQIKALSERCRVIAPDLRGFGQSSGGDWPSTLTMEQFADDLAALLDELGITEPIVLGGLSMGGYIAFAFYHKYAARLRGLVLCDTRAEPDTPEAAAARLETAERVLREGPGFIAETMLPKLLAPQTRAGRPDVVAALRKVILADDQRAIAAALRGMAVRPDSTPLLSTIACPTLVLVGQEDKLSPPDQMQAMAQRISNAEFTAIPDAGHLSPVEQPTTVTAAVEAFVSRLQ